MDQENQKTQTDKLRPVVPDTTKSKKKTPTHGKKIKDFKTQRDLFYVGLNYLTD